MTRFMVTITGKDGETVTAEELLHLIQDAFDAPDEECFVTVESSWIK